MNVHLRNGNSNAPFSQNSLASTYQIMARWLQFPRARYVDGDINIGRPGRKSNQQNFGARIGNDAGRASRRFTQSGHCLIEIIIGLHGHSNGDAHA